MKVQDAMIAGAKCCSPDDALSQAAQFMQQNDCGWVPVIDSDSRVVGVLTDRDICMAAYAQDEALSGIRVSSAMSHGVFGCRPSDDLLAAQRIMREHQVRRLPVANADGKLVGIVSFSDIALAVAGTSGGKAQVARTLLAICGPHRREAQIEPLEPLDQHRVRSRESQRWRAAGRSTQRAWPQ